MTDKEFADKVDYEGGIWSALEYGLRAADLANPDSELGRAWRAVETRYLETISSGDLSVLETILERLDMYEEDEDYDEDEE